jgi:hypothetical protein
LTPISPINTNFFVELDDIHPEFVQIRGIRVCLMGEPEWLRIQNRTDPHCVQFLHDSGEMVAMCATFPFESSKNFDEGRPPVCKRALPAGNPLFCVQDKGGEQSRKGKGPAAVPVRSPTFDFRLFDLQTFDIPTAASSGEKGRHAGRKPAPHTGAHAGGDRGCRSDLP